MTRTSLITPAAVALTIALSAGSAFAQSGGNDKQRTAHDRSSRPAASGSQNRAAASERSRSDMAVRRAEPRAEATRSYSEASRSRTFDNRGSDTRQYTTDRRDVSRRDVSPRGTVQYDNRRYDDRRYDNGRYSNRDYGWTGSYDRNAWRSRIRFGLGLSIFAGRPFGFHFDYGWRPRFDYRYQMQYGVTYGGISFLLDPSDAEVYIDGQFVGIAGDFGGQPVPVSAGYHRIELYANGFEPAAFDINVLPGEVIPYRGSLYRIY
jgi:hypothetical protein